MKIVLQYILMVGTAALGVYGLLRLGADLKAPVSVGGAWTLVAAPQSTDAGTCDALPVPTEGTALTISQSGPNLVLQMGSAGPVTLQGKIEGTTITAQTARDSKGASSLHLVAHVDRQAEPDRLQATLQSDACPHPISLVGTRQPTSQNDSGGP